MKSSVLGFHPRSLGSILDQVPSRRFQGFSTQQRNARAHFFSAFLSCALPRSLGAWPCKPWLLFHSLTLALIPDDGSLLLKGFILHLRFRYLFNNGTKLRIFWREIIKAYFPGQSTLLVKSDLIGLEAFTGIRNKEPCLLSQCGCSPMHFNLETFSENEKRTKINFKNSRIACTMIFGFNLFYDITILPYNMRKLTPVLVCWRSNHMDKKG